MEPRPIVIAIGIATTDETFAGSFQCSATPPDGRWQIEILGEGRFGTTVLANFPVFCGVPASFALPAASMRADAIRDPVEAERRIVQLIAEECWRAGLLPLQIDGRFVGVAWQHSLDM